MHVEWFLHSAWTIVLHRAEGAHGREELDDKMYRKADALKSILEIAVLAFALRVLGNSSKPVLLKYLVSLITC